MATTWITDENGVKWATDSDGNKCSVRYFGSEEKAEKALKSLENCKNCTNCSRCSRCSGCSDCSGCSGCSDCSGCSRCSRCSGCSGCSDCSGCSRCSGCSGCSDCSDCEKLQNGKDKEGIKPSWHVPEIENIHQKVLEAVSTKGAFDMSDWHTCDTTHCRAGWVVHLAGEAGYALEKFHTSSWHKGTALAASLIYHASCPEVPVSMPRFYEDNETAMADIKRCAELEKAE